MSQPLIAMPKSEGVTSRHRPNGRTRRRMKDAEHLVSALSDMSIPVSEQDRLAEVVLSAGTDKLVQRYVAALVAPKYFRSRVPDSYPRKTSLWFSTMTVDVYANAYSTTIADNGRFSMLINPSLGGLAKPHQYKVAMLDGTQTNWPTWNNLAGTFMSINNQRDIRIDPIAMQLTQPNLASYFVAGDQGTAITTAPFGTSGNLVSLGGYGLEVRYTVTPGPTPTGYFFPPPGLYVLNAVVGNNSGVVTTGVLTVATINGALYTQIYNSVSPGTAGSVPTTSTTGYLMVPPAASGQNGGGVLFSVPATYGAVWSNLSLVPAYDDNATLVPSYDYGAVNEYRTVAMSALFTPSAPQLTAGGMVAAAYLPGNAARTQFFGSSENAQGNFDAWENVAQIPGSYNGPYSEGAYVWWSPEADTDFDMHTPNDAIDLKSPSLIISGQFQPSTALTVGTPIVVGRLEVITQYEGFTNSNVFEKEYEAGSRAIIDSVNNHLAMQPHAMQNHTHVDFQKHVIESAPGMYATRNQKARTRNPGQSGNYRPLPAPAPKPAGMPWPVQALGQAVPWVVKNSGGISDAVGVLGDLIGALL